MATYLVAGTYLVINGITGDLADKQGVASVKIPVIFPDLATASKISLNPAAVLNAVGLNTELVCMGHPFRELEDGQFQVDFAFEGFNQPQTFAQAQDKTQYRFDLEMENAPIQSNPNFAFAQSVFGWDNDKQAFPQTAPSSTQSGYKVNQNQNGTTDSPAFGCTDWLRVGGILSVSYACNSVPASVYQNIGTILSGPPNGAAVFGIPGMPGRFWVKMPPEVDKQTNAIRVTEKTRLCTGDPMLARILYAQGQLG